MTGLPALPTATPGGFARLAKVIVVPLVLGAVLSAAAGNVVRVKRGDTLSEIARRYHTTVAALRELNNIPGSNIVYAGQTLRLPRNAIASTTGPRAAPRATARVPKYYTVVSGDSLIKLAARYRTSVSWLVARNKLPRSRVIVVGQRLMVGETAVAPARMQSGPDVARTPRPHAVPRERVKALIRAEAKRAGVDPHLALALAWQESGFQQDVVSSAGAIGAMQVMPDTGRWMSRNIVGRPLNLSNVEDNVIAGVRFLALLLRMTSTQKAALAGYYQGLASVKNNGEYASTKSYVSNILVLQRRFRRG